MGNSKGGVILAAGSAALTGKMWPGGKAMFVAEATWGGGSVALQVKAGGGTWVAVANGSLSANGTLTVDLPLGEVRVLITTATGVYANILHVPE